MTQPAHSQKVSEARSKASPEEIRIWNALEDVADPEFPVSVVDMGLIYGLQRSGEKATVQLSFTSMGCPAMEFILDDIRQRVLAEPGVNEIEIEIVWDPPWTRERLSPQAMEKLRSWGVTT